MSAAIQIQAEAPMGAADPILLKMPKSIPAVAVLAGALDPILLKELKLTLRRGNEEQNQGNTQSRKLLSHAEPRLRFHIFAL